MDVDQDPDSIAALAELAEIFGELVDTACAGQEAELPAERIVATAGRCLRRSQAAALVVLDDRGGSTVAATTDLGDRIARIRAETGQGPSFDVVECNDLVICDDLTSDERWPEFGRRVTAETGIR